MRLKVENALFPKAKRKKEMIGIRKMDFSGFDFGALFSLIKKPEGKNLLDWRQASRKALKKFVRIFQN